MLTENEKNSDLRDMCVSTPHSQRVFAEAGQAATRVLSSADQLAQQSTELRAQAAEFFAAIRAA